MPDQVTVHITFKYTHKGDSGISDEEMTDKWRKWFEKVSSCKEGDIVLVHAYVEEVDD